MQWIIVNILTIKIKHFQMNQISALNNPYKADMPLNE